MLKTFFAAALALAAVSTGSVAATPAVYRDPLDAPTLKTISSQFSKLMVLANQHDLKALHEMFWQSQSALLVAKSAIPSEGNWAAQQADRLDPLKGSPPSIIDAKVPSKQPFRWPRPLLRI